MARRLGRDGNNLVLAARRARELAVVAGESGTNARTVVADVTRREDVERLRDQAFDAFGSVALMAKVARGKRLPVDHPGVADERHIRQIRLRRDVFDCDPKPR